MTPQHPLRLGAIILAVALLAGCSTGDPADADTPPDGAVVDTADNADNGSASETSPDDTDETADTGTSGTTDGGTNPGGTSSDRGSSTPPQNSGGTPPSGDTGSTPPNSTPPAQSPPPSAPPTETPPASDPPAQAEPAIVITTMGCNGSGINQKLRVQLTADYNNKYRKGIIAVWLTRPNNCDTGWISQATAVWAGEYAGQGNRWSGELPTRIPSNDNYGYEPYYGKVLKVRVRVDTGQIWEYQYPIERDC